MCMYECVLNRVIVSFYYNFHILFHIATFSCSKLTLTAPIINMTDMRTVMARLMANIIFTIHDGRLTMVIVLNSTEVQNINIKATTANNIPITPLKMVPVRRV